MLVVEVELEEVRWLRCWLKRLMCRKKDVEVDVVDVHDALLT